MDLSGITQGTWQAALLGAVLILVFLALASYTAAKRSERRHPSKGSFLDVNGVRLHYSDRAAGRP
jgi:hypothetical protein